MKVLEGGWPKEAQFEPTFRGREYYDPDHFEKELEKIWFKTWLCAGREEEIPNKGDFFTIKIGGENLICIRAIDGSVSTFYNVCRHRGSVLCEEEKGNFKNGFMTCFYHSWTYSSNNGDLLGTPNIPNKDPNFRKCDHPLHTVKTETWDGYIWINMDPDAPSLKESFKLPDSWGLYQNYQMSELKLGAEKTYHVKANWKLLMENASECYHCGNIHPGLGNATPPNQPRALIDPSIPGTKVIKHVGGMTLRDGFDRVNLDGKAYRPNFEGISEEEQRKIYYLHIYPHSYICMASDYVFITTMFPIKPDETLVKAYWLFDPMVLESENPSIQDAIDVWDITSTEDWRAAELAQIGNQSRVYKKGGVYTPIDWRVANFKRYVYSELEK